MGGGFVVYLEFEFPIWRILVIRNCVYILAYFHTLFLPTPLYDKDVTPGHF